MRGRRIVKWIFAFACTVIAGCGFALAGEGYGLYKNAVQEESLEETVAEIRRQENFTSLEEMPETYMHIFREIFREIRSFCPAIWIRLSRPKARKGSSEKTV